MKTLCGVVLSFLCGGVSFAISVVDTPEVVTHETLTKELWNTMQLDLIELEAGITDGERFLGGVDQEDAVYTRGNVGIGTTSPSQALHIVTGTNYEGILINGNSAPSIGFDRSGGSIPEWKVGISGNNGTGFAISTGAANADKFFVSNSGDIGIGTTAPSAKLDLIGNYKQENSSGVLSRYNITDANADGVNGTWDFYTNTNVTPDFFGRLGFKFEGGTSAVHRQFQIYVGDVTPPKLVVNGSGNVGIGTSSPDTKTHMHELSSNSNYLKFTNDTTGQLGTDGAVIGLSGGESLNLWLYENDFMQFATNNTERMRIDSSGNVGIGTNSPTAKLEIDESTAAEGLTYLNLGSEINTGAIVTDVYGAKIVMASNDHVSGTDVTNMYGAYIENTSDGSGTTVENFWGIYVPAAGSRVGNAYGAYFADNVGIGTASPGAKLDILLDSNSTVKIGAALGHNDYSGIHLGFNSTGNLNYNKGAILFKRVANEGQGEFHFAVNNIADSSFADLSDSKLMIDRNGNIGIGTATPSAGLKLDIEGKVGATEYCDADGGNCVAAGSLGGSSKFVDGTDPLDAVYSGGNVGIGTTDPSQQLEITGNFELQNTTNANQSGIVYKGAIPFIHDFNYGDNGTVTTQGRNTFVGENAGNLTMGSTATEVYHGTNNTAIGKNSFSFNTTGYYNTAIGMQSLRSNTTGFYNTSIGLNSLYGNTAGYYNTANGVYALRHNTTGYENTAIGVYALYSNITGYENTAIGKNSLHSNTTGKQNTAIGKNVLLSNTAGHYNTASGYDALRSNTIGYHNTANGHEALYSNTTGYENTANGRTALYYNSTGSRNIANGSYAGSYIADGSTRNLTGDFNIFIGYNTKALADGDENEIVIGHNATGIGSNSVVLGNDSVVTTALKGNVGIGTTSPDEKLTVAGNIRVANSGKLYLWNDHDANYIMYDKWRTSAGAGMGIINGAATGHLYMSTDSIERLRIDSSGNVGIGTTTPQAKFDVAGIGRFGALSSTGRSVNVSADGSAGTIQVRKREDEAVKGLALQPSGGVVGIGYSTGDTNTAESNGAALVVSGNVGIGTTTPDAKFVIQDVAYPSGVVAGADDKLVIKDSNYAYLNFISENVQGLIFSDDARQKGSLQYDHGTDSMIFRANSATRMTIDNTGNVGIGETIPAEKLDVAGNVEADAYLYSSDRRLKENIQNMDEDSFSKILNINPVYFDWKDTGKPDTGVIAQDVEKYFPEFVHTNGIGNKTVDYPKLVVPVLGVIKVQNDAIAELQAEMELLKTEIKNLKN